MQLRRYRNKEKESPGEAKDASRNREQLSHGKEISTTVGFAMRLMLDILIQRSNGLKHGSILFRDHSGS